MAPQFDTKISRRESREYRRVNGFVVSPSRKASSTPSVEEKKEDRPSEEPAGDDEGSWESEEDQ